MSKVFTDVGVFMSAVGHTEPPFHADDSDQSKLYKVLIDEEYDEFIKAWDENNDVEKIDACFDMMWVIVGYMKSRGWDCEGIWDEGAKSNLAKIDPETGFVRRREDGKILKPDGWQPPNFSKFI
jgi:predicted HAD superfamily Cof-like phosphohydrolase